MPLNSYRDQSTREPYGRQRYARGQYRPIPFAMNIWTAAAALIVIVLVILGLSGILPQRYWSRAGLAAAILVLIVRQIARRSGGSWPGPAKPDPKSTLKLD